MVEQNEIRSAYFASISSYSLLLSKSRSCVRGRWNHIGRRWGDGNVRPARSPQGDKVSGPRGLLRLPFTFAFLLFLFFLRATFFFCAMRGIVEALAGDIRAGGGSLRLPARPCGMYMLLKYSPFSPLSLALLTSLIWQIEAV